MTIHPWAHYPMGPKLTTWLSIGQPAIELSDKDREGFTAFVINYGAEHAVKSEDYLIDLVDELVTMDLPLAALKLIDMNSDVWTRADFRGVLAEGIAAMITGEFPRAELCFSAAQETAPDEPAPYSNMAEILLIDQRLDEARQWIQSGLQAANNHYRLWELFLSLSRIEARDEHSLATSVFAKAKELNSWAGTSLAAEIDPEANPNTKVTLLEPFYNAGEREDEFLIEFTGALGAAGEMEKIPQIVWSAERISGRELSWRLYIHCAQSYLAMGKHSDFLKTADKLTAIKDVPPDVIKYLENHRIEAQSELTQAPLEH